MILQTVIETPEFISNATACMDSESHDEFIHFIAGNPLAGQLVPGTGGVRKIRWQSRVDGGKRAGVRVIYYYYDDTLPIYLFTVYKKNQKESMTAEEKKILHKIIKLIVKAYKGE